MLTKIRNYIRGKKKYKEMKVAANIAFTSFYWVLSDTIKDIRANISEDGNTEYLEEMQKDGVWEVEGIIYVLWFYKQHGEYSKDFGKLWLDEIHNVYYRKMQSEGISKSDLEFFIKHINQRYGEYNVGSNPKKLLHENIVKDHSVHWINLSQWEDNIPEAKLIVWYIKVFANMLDKNISVYIDELKK